MPSEVQSWKVSFSKLPKTLEELQALPEASLDAPYKTAALTVAALCLWPENKEESKKMITFLSGPKEPTPYTWQFINDRFMDGVDYIPRSYFEGATPDNDYTPSQPLTITIYDDPYGHGDEGYCGLMLQSGGADSRRPIKLRNKPSTGQWFLWEQFLLVQVRTPKKKDPWA